MEFHHEIAFACFKAEAREAGYTYEDVTRDGMMFSHVPGKPQNHAALVAANNKFTFELMRLADLTGGKR